MAEQMCWRRLHPQPRRDDMADALRAPVRDPMWMLSRQWQVGEFEGEDGGSPVRADLDVSIDETTAVDFRGSETPPAPYDGGPLEAMVEREPIATSNPSVQTRVEAGQQFRRMLSESGYGEYGAEAFHSDLRVERPDEPLESTDRRYVELVADRALDGAKVALAIQSAVGNIDADGDAASWAGVTADRLPVPETGSRTSTFDEVAQRFYEWYVGLYDEPAPDSGAAWDPSRLAYRFAVATGADDTETVFEVDDYQGGSLDWAAFSLSDEESLGLGGGTATDDDGPTTRRSTAAMPTQTRFPGMPATRWWEFEDGDVDLAKMTDDGATLPRLLLTEFAAQFGNDWFEIPLELPVGTLARITDLTVTDSFGTTETAEPALDDDWQLFMHDLDGRPGLFLPPTLSDSVTGDPVEEVTFARDEMANLAFAIEETVESPTGRAIDRTSFRVPQVEIDRVTAADDPDEEYVTLANPGDDRLELDGFAVKAAVDGSVRQVHKINSRTLDPGETVELYTGAATDEDAISGGLSASVWTDAEAVNVTDAAGDLTATRLLSRPNDALADYRLATAVPDHWFPFRPEQGWEFKLERALLLDADSLGLPVPQLPKPRGRILEPTEPSLDGETYEIYDEEVTRGGRAVSRQYQFARWTDGTGHLWSTRRSRPADLQVDSGLQFDILDDDG